jgi:hypothetical protein
MSKNIMAGMFIFSAVLFAGIEVSTAFETVFTTGMSLIFMAGALWIIRENIIDKGV